MTDENESVSDTYFTDGADGSITDTMLDSPAKPTMPFYSSYIVFYKALQALKSDVLPRRLNSTSLAALGDEASRVVRGFRAMGLLDEIGLPTDGLRELIASFRTPRWSATLKNVIAAAYPYVPLDEMADMTSQGLSEIFIANAGRKPDAMRNALTFFLCLASEAGVAMPEEFSRRAARGVTEAHRWLRLNDLDEPLAQITVATPAVSSKAIPSATRDHLLDKIGELTSLLTMGDMTEEEKKAVLTLLTYFGRKRNTASPSS